MTQNLMPKQKQVNIGGKLKSKNEFEKAEAKLKTFLRHVT